MIMFCIVFWILLNVLFPTITTNKSEMASSNHNNTDRGILLLVNKSNPLTEDYIPPDLAIPNINGSTKGSLLLRKEAVQALEKLLAKAHMDNINLYCLSGYRSFKTQKQLYDEKVIEAGKAIADKYIAYPGQSEHQTGLAMDIANKESVNQLLRASFGDTREGEWLRNNVWEFGFIIRYPRGKEKITGYSYEPWHIRYVGIKASKEMKIRDIVLEEYLKDPYEY